METEGLEQPNPFGVLVWPEHEEMQLSFGACESGKNVPGSTGAVAAGSTAAADAAGSTGSTGAADAAAVAELREPLQSYGKAMRYQILAEYRPLLLEFLRRHSGSFVQLEFVQLDSQQQSQGFGGSSASSGSSGDEAAAGAVLMPTVRALDATGGKIECFRPLRVHIPGW